MSTSYVVCAALHGVTHVFNVEDLWMRALRRQKGVFLMDALTQHLRTRRDRNHAETCFHHVIVRIPKADYDHDERVEDGFNRAALIRDLVKAHGDKLGKYVPPGEVVRYRVEADPALPKGEVRFLFGRAIYLPGDGEPSAYWLYRQDEAGRRELGVVYPSQRVTLLNSNGYASTIPVSDWPFAADQSVLLIVKPNQPPTVYPEPEDGRLTVRTEGQRIFLVTDASGGASLCLRIEPQPLQDAERRHEDLTWTPGGEPSSVKRTLRVVGMALPRLSRHAHAGLQGWRLGFDQYGALARCQHPNAMAWLRIDGEDRVWGEAGGDSMLLSPSTVWRPHDDWTLELGSVPAMVDEQYWGWVRLPRPVLLSAPVGQWLSFGRGVDADLNPGLLNDPDALIWNETRHIPPEQLLLSRRHLALRMAANEWMAKLLSDKWPVYWLSPSGDLRQTLTPADGGQEFAVPRHELLIVGGYVLQLG